MDKCLLKQVETQELASKEFGFYWENPLQLIEQIMSECEEIKEALQHSPRSHLEEEIGDLMLASVSLAVFCQFDPHETLKKSISKFQKRFEHLKQLVLQDGKMTLENEPFEVLVHYWKKAKKLA